MSSLSSEFAEAVTGVFWDVVDCGIPNHLYLDVVVENIKSALNENGYRGKVSISAYCDVKNSEAVAPSAFEYSGIELRRGRRNSMLDDILFFALDHKPASLMVISKDISTDAQYVEHLSKLKEKNRNLLLVQIDSVTGELFGSVSSIWYWTDLANGGIMPAFQSGRSCLEQGTSEALVLMESKQQLPRIYSPPRSLFFLWDYENCPIPRGYDVKNLCARMERFLSSQNLELTLLKGFGTNKSLSPENWLSLKDTFGLEHVEPRSDKDSADFKIKRSLLLHLIDKAPPSLPCLVFTGDKDFLQVFYRLRKRGYHLYLGYNDQTRPLLLKTVEQAWHYYDVIGFDRATRQKPKRKRIKSAELIARKRQKRLLGRQNEVGTGGEA